MEVKFDVKMNQKIMYDFLMSHTYKSPAGILGIIFGLAALVIFAVTLGKVDSWQSILYVFFGVWFILYLPVNLYLRSVKQVKLNPVFRKPITYQIDEEGISTFQDGQSARISWEDLQKVRETKRSLLVYTGKRNSFVLPKECMADRCEEAVSMIRRHMDPQKVKIKSTKQRV